MTSAAPPLAAPRLGWARALAADLADLADRVTRSAVQVRGRDGRNGSGVVWGGEGLIVTNAHVAREPRMRVELWDGRALAAAVVSRDRALDLAALAVDAQLPAAPVGDSEALRVGEIVVAVGCPCGVRCALAYGIVHAVGPVDGLGGRRWVQADVRLAPGNSGGPLVDAAGRVVGINSMIARGLGLAVPTAAVQSFLMGLP